MGARPYLWGLVLVCLACRAEELPCARIGELCTGETWQHPVAARVDDAVAVDVDGDGVEELVALTRAANQVALGFDDKGRTVMTLPERPVALAGLGREVAVALAGSPEGAKPGVAILGVDAERRLERRRDLPLEFEASDVWSGDLDGDGELELVVAHPPGGRLTLLDPGTGKGRTITVGGIALAVEAADLDGDAVLDLVVADPARSSVHVLRGAGGGEFDPPRKFLAIEEIGSLALGDADGDGDVDVLARNMKRPGVVVLHNNGKGELSLPLELEFTEPLPTGSGLAVGPVSGGSAGITVPQGERLATWLREGTGWFGHVEEYLFEDATWVGRTAAGLLVGGMGYVGKFEYKEGATPFEVWRDPSVAASTGKGALAVGDLDGDGLVDVAAAAGTELVIYRATADGLVAEAPLPVEVAAKTMFIAEVTGDLRPDLVLGDREVVQVVRAEPDGSFTKRPVHSPVVPPLGLVPLRRGTSDGDFVAVVPNGEFTAYGESNRGVALLRYDGGGVVAEETVLLDSWVVRALTAVDVDGDGEDEALLFGRRDGVPVLMRMMPSVSGFEPGPEHDMSEHYGVPPGDPESVSLVTGDPDRDGVPEVWLNGWGGRLRISGLGGEPTVVPADDMLGPSHFRDIDGDGELDAVSVGDYGSFRYQRGRGDGSFEEEEVRYDFPGDAIISLTPTTGAGFDLVSMSRSGVGLHRLRAVARPVEVGFGDAFGFHGRVSELAVRDLNQDGYDDVVTISNDYFGGVQVLWGDETGALARADGLEDYGENRGLTLGDIDGDGIDEVFVSNAISSIEAYRFSPRFEAVPMILHGLNSLERVQDLAVADVDADGHADVLALAYAQYQGDVGMRLTVAFGEGGDSLLRFSEWRQVSLIEGGERARLEVGDVDGDALVDLLVRLEFDDGAPVLVRAEGPRVWSEPVVLPGAMATFTPRDAKGRVSLLVHDGDTIARLRDGNPERRETLLRHAELAGAALIGVVDVDGDGRGDLIVLTAMGYDIWLHGDDGYRRATTIEDMWTVEVGDVDGDRQLDLVGVGVGGTVAVRFAAKRE